jgi:transposase-like protein
MRFSAEEKRMWLEDWQQSGKSAWAYAKGNGLNPQTFVKWAKMQDEKNQGFVEVPTQVTPPHHYSREIVIEKGDVKIHIPLLVNGDELRAIMEGLGRAL